MKCTYDAGTRELTIKVTLETKAKAPKSKSGKSKVLATTGGFLWRDITSDEKVGIAVNIISYN